ncbi:MAG: UDP-N-acetylmuramoyl-tripeptide--D-alanyl-D-alanine ligase [Phycisphaerales bacterium]
MRDLTGGRLHAGGDAARAEAALAGVNTDSRSVTRGQVFVALRGERFDGHAFVGQAAAAGAGLIVVDRGEAVAAAAGTPALVVEDTRKALGKMAAGYRDVLGRMGAKVIAVCGSNGKTTTTRMIDAVLGASMRGTASQKSFNNDVGVPLTILGATPGDKYLLCEVGSNAPGEIATLGAIVRPDIAVITSIGREHLQGFGDLAGVAREEGSIAAFVPSQPKGVVIATADAPELRPHLLGRLGTRLKLFGRAADAEPRLNSCEHISDIHGMGLSFSTADGAAWRLGLLGKHNATNALAAIAVGREFGLKDAAIAAALEKARGPEMRLQVMEAGGIRIINDAYNANPESMLAAIETFGEVSRGAARRVLVLGDMRELGTSTEASHREVGRAAAAVSVDLLVAIGESMAWAAEEARGRVRVEWMAGTNDADFAAAAGMVREGDAVLVKGSRGMRMERVVAGVKAKAEGEGSKFKVQSSNVH